jgi:hypothetical protein
MDTVFPLKSKKTIKAVNQAVVINNTIMRLKIQNALYQQELNKVKSANAALALVQQNEQAAKAFAALVQKQTESSLELIKKNRLEEQVATQGHANIINKKSTKFGKLLSNMNKHN